MRTRALAPRERKLVAILLLVAALTLGHLLLIAPLAGGFSERAERRALLRAQAQANQRLIDSIPRLRRQAERQRSELADFVLSAPNASIASAVLQERVQTAIESAGGELRSAEEVSGTDGLVRARVTARITLDQLTRLLARLGDQRPYLNIDSLAVAADQAVISGRLEPLDVSLEASIPFARAASR